jgi:phage terminase small subunit
LNCKKIQVALFLLTQGLMKKTATKKTYPELTQRRLDFAKFYLIDPNGEQSAIKAGFSRLTAAQQASRLLNNVKVQAEIARLRKAREDRLEASADFVVRELMRLAKFDIRDAFDPITGQLKDIKDMSEDVAKCISSIEVKDLYEYDEDAEKKVKVGNTKTIRVWDKKGALELLGQHFGIFKRPGDEDPDKTEKKEKLSLLQVIKSISKDGHETTITNRISGGKVESVGVDQPRARGYQIL